MVQPEIGARASDMTRFWRLAHSALLLLLAVPFVWIGGQLAAAGGSLYYLASGLLLLCVVMLHARGSRNAGRLYAVWLIATAIWAIWEVGLDGWALTPRIALPLALGVPFAFVRHRKVTLSVLAIAASILIVAWAMAVQDPVPPSAPDAAGPYPHPRVAGEGDWLNYGNDPGGQRYSRLDQISRATVGQLEPAWTFSFGRVATKDISLNFEATPLKVGDKLFFCTGLSEVIALDAETGKQVWRYNPQTTTKGVLYGTCRGVAFHRMAGGTGICASRILAGTLDARLIALDAETGRPCPGFGDGGTLNLRERMGEFSAGTYYPSSAAQVIGQTVVVNGFVQDNESTGEPSGMVRAFDATTGKLQWAFDTGRLPEDPQPAAGADFSRGGPNSWGPMSADPALGLVYVPTGAATPDYVSAHRSPAALRYESSLIALDAATGKVRWSFQTAHRDVWDYDVPAQPTLIDLPDGVPAVVQPTKRGQLFILDRRNGRPLAPIEEKPVPRSRVPGERLSPTQPFSVGMPNLYGTPLTEADMWGITPVDQALCRLAFRRMRYEGEMTPPDVERTTLVYPGRGGGMEWGGVSYDPVNRLLITNTNHFGQTVRLIPRSDPKVKVLEAYKGPRRYNPIDLQRGTPYAAEANAFLSPLFVPCKRPPWGMVTAIDMTTRKIVWSRPLGTGRDSGPFMIPSHIPFSIGAPMLGGSIVTAGGLTFIGATADSYLRVLDTRTGRELRRFRLPTGAQATPMTYWSEKSRRQFVVIAAGGNTAMGTKPGDTIAAFALPPARK